MLTSDAWRRRYLEQAGWTATLRHHLYQQVGLRSGLRSLEVGCGTGAVCADLTKHYAVASYGIDLLPEYLRIARKEDPRTRFSCADAYAIPYHPATFDVVYCHMFLLWVADPGKILQEINRVLRPGGWFLALAEPDYGGRIDYPTSLSELGRLQSEALASQGAFPMRGRELAGLLLAANLSQVETGLLGGQWKAANAMQGFSTEWQVLRADLSGQVDELHLDRLQQVDKKAREIGERILFVPTWYAIGKKLG